MGMLMDVLAGVSLLASGFMESQIHGWLEQAFYPALFIIFVIASLGVPIPEDVPLLMAGVILRTSPEIASWPLTILVSMVGIMSGDLILYTLGRTWGDDVFAHRSVRWLITPVHLRLMKKRFRRHGTWMVFFGRFVVGVRAMMCLSAGVTRFPYWRFFLADFCGAIITTPGFIGLGYVFAYAFPTLQRVLGDLQVAALILAILVVGALVWYHLHRKSKRALIRAQRRGVGEEVILDETSPAIETVSPAEPVAAPAAKNAPSPQPSRLASSNK